MRIQSRCNNRCNRLDLPLGPDEPRRAGGRIDRPYRGGASRPTSAAAAHEADDPLQTWPTHALVSQVDPRDARPQRPAGHGRRPAAGRPPTARPSPGIATRSSSTGSPARSRRASARSHVRLDTICNAPAVEASGHLSYGNALVGIINWPTCLLYPEGPTADETQVRLGAPPAPEMEVRHGPQVERHARTD